MAHIVLEQNMTIAASPEVVRAQLARLMSNLKDLHPFVIAVEPVKTTTGSDGRPIQHYRVRDRVKLGPKIIEFTYRVDVTVSAQDTLVSNAYQVPGIHLYNMMWCEAEGSGTRVRERIEITAPRLLMKITSQGAINAHKEMLQRLKERAEQGMTKNDIA